MAYFEVEMEHTIKFKMKHVVRARGEKHAMNLARDRFKNPYHIRNIETDSDVKDFSHEVITNVPERKPDDYQPLDQWGRPI